MCLKFFQKFSVGSSYCVNKIQWVHSSCAYSIFSFDLQAFLQITWGRVLYTLTPLPPSVRAFVKQVQIGNRWSTFTQQHSDLILSWSHAKSHSSLFLSFFLFVSLFLLFQTFTHFSTIYFLCVLFLSFCPSFLIV